MQGMYSYPMPPPLHSKEYYEDEIYGPHSCYSKYRLVLPKTYRVSLEKDIK